VTVTHTAGVLLLGLLISGSSALAGESVLSWLGVLSGVLVMGVGGWLLRSALRNRRHPHTVSGVRELALVGGGTVAAPETAYGHGHGHGHGHSHSFNRGGLIGMGIAGGLVPSPSALVVLLGAVALGRTWFGVLLVFGYGFGMAATLTAVGLVLVRLRDRLDTMPRVDKLRLRLGRLSAWMPVLTAGLVLVVGLGLALRAATGNG
jgi:ABC-type nickel/cobalt efflux system permease component RcnA